jgi:proline racemase
MHVSTLDAHVAGGAVRLVKSGLPTLDGRTIAEKRSSFEAQASHLAEALSREPRGHAGIVGVVLTEPERAEADCGMVFFTGAGCRAVSGHAAMGAVALAVAAGILAPRQPGRIEADTEAGPLVIEYDAADVVTFPCGMRVTGAPAHVVRGAARVTTGRRTLAMDIAWSGSELVAVVDGESAGVPLSAAHTLELRRAAREVLDAVEQTLRVTVPGSGDRGHVSGCVFVGPASDDRAAVRAVMVRDGGAVSRTASASGSAALGAVLAAMGLAASGGQTRIENLVGLSWTVELGALRPDGGWPITIAAEVHATGTHTFVLDPSDPLLRGAAWA